MAGRLRWVMCSDSVKSWESAGFRVGSGSTGSNVVSFPNCPVQIVLTCAAHPNPAAQKGIQGLTGWTWSGLQKDGDIAGIPTARIVEEKSNGDGGKVEPHPNGIIGIDHVVLRTSNLKRTKESLESFGLSLKRERLDIYPGITQAFYRPNGDFILEVVGPTPGTKEAVKGSFLGDLDETEVPITSLWGITFVSKSLDETKHYLDEKLSKIRDAKQPGRKIATLRHEDLGITVPVAIMSPHQESSASKL